MPKAGFISFRLGGTDGVSIVAAQWMDTFTALGYEVHTIAGQGPVHTTIPSLAIDSSATPTETEIIQAIEGLDLVVVENLLTIPLHVEASLVLARALRGRRAILHHHDPPWQQAKYRHLTALPIDNPSWRHVTINHAAQAEFAERGIATTTIWNTFEPPTRRGDRSKLRAQLEVGANEILALHPVRAIARKNIPGALEFCETLGATYWLQGEVEEDYRATLNDILAKAKTRVIRRKPTENLTDAYAACDLVLFPSHHEGFGNPPFEAALHRRLSVVADYPVLEELRSTGLSFLHVANPLDALAALRDPDSGVLDRNERIVRTQFSPARLRQEIEALLTQF